MGPEGFDLDGLANHGLRTQASLASIMLKYAVKGEGDYDPEPADAVMGLTKVKVAAVKKYEQDGSEELYLCNTESDGTPSAMLLIGYEMAEANKWGFKSGGLIMQLRNVGFSVGDAVGMPLSPAALPPEWKPKGN